MADTGSEAVGERLREVAELVRKDLSATHEERENALRASRQTIQLASRSIRATHRGQFDEARALWEQARDTILPVAGALRDRRDFFDGALLHDAEKEYAEAGLTLALVAGERLPLSDDLGVGAAPYLHGLTEAACELRRAALDALRLGDAGRAERLLSHMEEVYGVLITLDFPEAVTRGLRRATDMLRGVLERTRGDVTLAARQMALERRLGTLEERLDGR